MVRVPGSRRIDVTWQIGHLSVSNIALWRTLLLSGLVVVGGLHPRSDAFICVRRGLTWSRRRPRGSLPMLPTKCQGPCLERRVIQGPNQERTYKSFMSSSFYQIQYGCMCPQLREEHLPQGQHGDMQPPSPDHDLCSDTL
ncbi:hypothetical protein PHLGIDRAFT_157387 [Phlebiopsis gigantea 11061_1 CR5-6]|uniref:Uncharacterized protein n=1 Tax=Phlebiopsis gigantea (strain 11061_1 CR5-6) TaxID=745531 RepID=A0A0C3SCR2_PHLG1|nr:hypothetical protein PHLGIDRAFT_157387 [Phlebiopsis gigantea 11061_1 CR5-6]